jgi:hypothetical protein
MMKRYALQIPGGETMSLLNYIPLTYLGFILAAPYFFFGLGKMYCKPKRRAIVAKTPITNYVLNL